MGVMSSVASLARIIGPVLGGWLLARDGSNALTRYGITPYWVSGGLMVVAILLALALDTRPEDSKEAVRVQT
jgi:MFS family permease